MEFPCPSRNASPAAASNRDVQTPSWTPSYRLPAYGSVRKRRIGGCARVPAMKTFAGDFQHRCVRNGGRHHHVEHRPTMSGWPSTAAEFATGRGLHRTMSSPLGAPSADMPSSSRKQASAERNADRISRFLAARRPALFCDDCIADKLGLGHRREANRITSALGKIIVFGGTSALARFASSTSR